MKHRAGAVSDFEAGSIKIIELGGRSIGIVNTAGELYAVLNICPHALAPICEGRLTGTMLPSAAGEADWGLDGRILRCPWHGYEYDLGDGGRTVFTSFRARVRMFAVTVEEGEVYVEIPELPGAKDRRADVADGSEASRADSPAGSSV